MFLLACAALIVAMFWDNATGALVLWSPTADYWADVAVLREWLQNGAPLSNPLVNDSGLSARFVPHLLALSVIGKLLGMDAIQLMVVGGVVNVVLIAIGLRLFLSYYFRQAWAPFLGVLVLFTFWGVAGIGPGNGPGIFQLRNFLHIAAGPSSFAFGISLIGFWVTMRLLRSGTVLPIWALSLVTLQALVFVSHPLTGLFCASGCLLLVFTEFSTSVVTQLAAIVAVLVGLAVAELWPFFSVWKLTLGLYGIETADWVSAALFNAPLEGIATRAWGDALYDPSTVVAVLGLSLLGVPVVLRLMQRGEQPFVVYGVLLMLVPYLLNTVFTIPLAHRFLLFGVFYLQLALVWGWLRLISAWSEIPRPPLATPILLLSVLVGIFAATTNVWLVFQEKAGHVISGQTLNLVDSRSVLPDGINVPDLYGDLLQPVAEDGVVLATPATGWPVPAFKGRVVALLNHNPLLPDGMERAQASDAFFYQAVDDVERIAIIQRYKVSNVLVYLDDPGLHADLIPWLSSYSRLVASRGAYRMYELATALQRVQLPQPPAEEADRREVPDAASAVASGRPEPDGRVTEPRDSALPVISEPAPDDASQAPDGEAPRSFGAPIAPPVLDPERHGG